MATSMKRVLVVDDDPRIRELLHDHFAGRYAVETVPNGVQAFGAILRSRPDVIVLDIVLPGVDGVHLLTALREVAAGIPVVVITGHDNQPMVEQALKDGAYGYVIKPFDMHQLDDLVGAALRHGQSR